MLDLFIFTKEEVLIILRFIHVLAIIIVIPPLTFITIWESLRAISLGRFIINTGRKVRLKETIAFIKHCYKFVWRGYTKKYDDGSYWSSIGDWRYFDKNKNKYINGRYSKDKW